VIQETSDQPAAIPTVGSILQFTPAAGRVSFVSGDERWDLPLIGWAVVVGWVAEKDLDSDDLATYETGIEPVVLDDETGGHYPYTMHHYLCDRDAGTVRWAVELP